MRRGIAAVACGVERRCYDHGRLKSMGFPDEILEREYECAG